MISGFAHNGKMGEACKLFLVMPNQNSVLWSAMISGYVECGNLECTLELFEVAPVKSVVGYMDCNNYWLYEVWEDWIG
jgi:pentatricopeptide repeat protein